MQIKRLIYVLVPIIALSPSAMANTEGESDDNGIIISKRESTTSPGGFSSVAEPAGPSDTKSTEQSPPLKHQARSTSTSLTPTELLQIRRINAD